MTRCAAFLGRGPFAPPAIIIMIAIVGLAIGTGISLAYGSSSGAWTSVGCPYSGYSGAASSFGTSSTYDDEFTSCTERIVVKYQAKINGVWGPVHMSDVPASYGVANYFEFVDAQIVYGQHQQKVGGVYRQWETTFTW